MEKIIIAFLCGNMCFVSAFAESFLKATKFPKTVEDLSFKSRVELEQDSYASFADLSAYDILTIVETDKNIEEEIKADEQTDQEQDEQDCNKTNECKQPKNTVPVQTPSQNDNISYIDQPTYNSSAYCQTMAPHIPQGQKYPIGKPVLESDYTYCSGYGVRNMAAKGKPPKYDNHYGFDIGCKERHFNKPVFTPADGIVEKVQPNKRGSSAGNYIVINHQNEFKTYYMHLNTMLVNEGQTVSAGCQIGTIGYTGGAKINKKQFENDDYPVMYKGLSHLHYEMHYTGSAQYVHDLNGKQIRIEHKFPNHKSINPAYFMGVK